MPLNLLNEKDVCINGRRSFIINIFKEAFDELDPEKLVKPYLAKLNLSSYEKVFVIGFGKASMAMYAGIRNALVGRLSYAGIIVPEDENVIEYPELQILRGTHPYTSQASVDSSVELLSHVHAGPRDLVIVLISGGGSSLFEIPEDGIDISFISEMSRKMMEHGSNIYELNAIRSALSRVKGGKLAKILYPARIVSFIVSDVPGDDISVIASGPLVKTRTDPRMVYEKYRSVLDSRVQFFMDRSIIDDTYFRNVENLVILKNSDFVNFVYQKIGKDCISLGSGIEANVDFLGTYLDTVLHDIHRIIGRPFWFVFGGETTVNVRGKGIGGRNLELSLRFMKNTSFTDFLFVSIGTDGIDGSSPAAGGIVDGYERRNIKDEDMESAIEDNDSYTFLSKVHGAIMTGRTGTNVSDIIAGYIGE